MRMDLIQPFIGSLDAVLAEMMQAPATIADLAMEENGYRKKGLAAQVMFRGQIEGRIILDMEPRAAQRVAQCLAGGEVDSGEPIIRETVCFSMYSDMSRRVIAFSSSNRNSARALASSVLLLVAVLMGLDHLSRKKLEKMGNSHK